MTCAVTITVPGQAKPARLTIDVDTRDYDGLETLMIAAIHASTKLSAPWAPGDFTHEDGEIDLPFCLTTLIRSALPTRNDFVVFTHEEED